MAESPLIIENLSFRYRDHQDKAIDRITFNANQGEILLIAGASGCGKTDLLCQGPHAINQGGHILYRKYSKIVL
jgi:energy-coupling factor transporter ATP-binding protein EcfA2